MKKRLLLAFLTMCIVCAFFPVTAFAGIEDTIPPMLNSLAFDKTTVEAPGTITVTANVSDDISGVATVMIVWDGQPSGAASNLYLDETAQASIYSGMLEIGEYEATRTQRVKEILLVDKADNVKTVQFDNEYSFSVTNSGTADTTPPTLNSLAFDKTTVDAPGTITVTANVSDDISGVATVMIKWGGQPSGAVSNLYLHETAQTGIYCGTLEIGAYEAARTQRIEQIFLKDKAGNGKWSQLGDTYSFTVTNSGTADTTPPTLNSLAFDKTTVEAPGTITVTANVSDDISGVATVMIRWDGQPSGAVSNLYLHETAQAGIYSGTLEIGVYEAARTQRVKEMLLVDKANNEKTVQYNNEHSFAVTRDTTPPILTEGTVSRTSNTAATVGFATNEAGTAYYNVVESGAPAAVITDVDTIKGFPALGAVSAGAVTGRAVALTAGAKDIYVYMIDGNDNYCAGLKIEAAAYVASSDASLSALTLNTGTLSPVFDASTTSYTASVKNAVNSVTISATANEEHATINGTGGKALSVGNNMFSITVTAEDGTTKKIYTITITRASAGTPGGSTPGGSTPTEPIAPTTPMSPEKPPAPPVTAPNAPEKMTDTIGHWGKVGIDYVISRGLFVGTSETTFSPNTPMTRAMVWTVLARLDGQDTSGGASWYEQAQTWAEENKISDGTMPQSNVTREQLISILYRYSGSPAASMNLNSFGDGELVSSWASDAMQWAVQGGLIFGSNNMLNPRSDATRAEVSTILMRYIQLTRS